ncbi:thermonuclease family protein [Candidatus Saccharibacteria bacterium]|nr:thermonuclease family protein [Candidatus Saccharibacteria bacterium]
MKEKIRERGGFWKVLSGFLTILLAIILIVVLFKAIFALREARKLEKERKLAEEALLDDGDLLSEDSDENLLSETEKDVLVGESKIEKPELSGEYLVSEVIDGDTVDILINGVETRIRLIGVDTPETKHPDKAAECFGEEATEYLRKMLTNKTVKIEADESQDDKDTYGRLLRYIWVDGENLNYLIIRNGFGFEYTFEEAYKYQEKFKQAEFEARTAKMGLWKKCML